MHIDAGMAACRRVAWLVLVVHIDTGMVCRRVARLVLKKVKFSHTRYRALGPELIPVYRQSARR